MALTAAERQAVSRQRRAGRIAGLEADVVRLGAEVRVLRAENECLRAELAAPGREAGQPVPRPADSRYPAVPDEWGPA